MRGKILPWGFPEVATVSRASRCVGNVNILYHLAYPNGGTDPEALLPSDPSTKGCDCIGFALWAAGLDRYQPHRPFPSTPSISGPYINTDSMMEEAAGWEKRPNLPAYPGGKWFTRLQVPEPGCFIVGHSFRRLLPYPRRVVGHIGVVTECSEWVARGLPGLGVVHCSPGNYKYTGGKSAVWKTAGTLWKMYPNWGFYRFNRQYALALGKP